MKEDKYLKVAPTDILGPHTPDCESVVLGLVKEMRSKGWNGRPLIVMRLTEKERKQYRLRLRRKYYALTGSHRREAARRVGIQVPVVVINDNAKQAILGRWRSSRQFMFFPNCLAYTLKKAGERFLSKLMILDNVYRFCDQKSWGFDS